MTSWATKFGTNPITKLKANALLWDGLTGVGEIGVLSKYFNIVEVQADGDDTNGNGSALSPFRTVSHAEFTITDASPTNIYVIKRNGAVDDTGAALLFKPNIYIIGDGSVWYVGDVGLHSSWTIATGNISFLIANHVLDVDGTWNMQLAAINTETATLAFENCSLNNPVTATTELTFDFKMVRDRGLLTYFNNCQFSDPFASYNLTPSSTVINIPSDGKFIFQDSVMPGTLYCSGFSTPAQSNAYVITRNCTPSGNQYGIQCRYTSGEFDFNDYLPSQYITLYTSASVGSSTFLDRQAALIAKKVDSCTPNDVGSGYTTATVTFSASTLPHGKTATGIANIVGGAVTSISVTEPGEYDPAFPPEIVISGDGTGADYLPVMIVPGTIILYTIQTTDTIGIAQDLTFTNLTVPDAPTGYGKTETEVFKAIDAAFTLPTSSDNSIDISGTPGAWDFVAASAGSPPARSYLEGFTITFASGATIQVSASLASQATLYDNNSVNNPITVVGDNSTLFLNLTTVGAGGLDQGVVAANTRYYIFLITHADGSNKALVASLLAGNILMPTDYTKQRLIGSWRTRVASANLATMIQSGRSNARTYYLIDAPAQAQILAAGNDTTPTYVPLYPFVSPFAQDLILTPLCVPVAAGDGFSITNLGNSNFPIAQSAQGTVGFGNQFVVGIPPGDPGIHYKVSAGTVLLSLWVYAYTEYL